MSDALAIAAVTEGLRAKLATAIGDVVSTDSLDKIGDTAGAVLNLYLYQILPNAHWRNMDVPWKIKPGETGRAPLALDLHYLLTAAAAKPVKAQEHLGAGMLALHDDPVLDPVGGAAPFERATITMRPLSLDETEKLWTNPSVPRLLSVAYEVSVVLIESKKPMHSPLPVLSRGTGSDAIEVQAGLFATIERIEIGKEPLDQWLRSRSRPGRTAAQVGDTIYFYGHGLSDASVAVIHLLRPGVTKDVEVKIAPGQNDRGGRSAVLDPASLRAGPCNIVLKIPGGTKEKPRIDTTNGVPLAIAPKIDFSPKTFKVPEILMVETLTVEFKPPINGHDSVVLIIADQQLPPNEKLADDNVSSLTFELKNLSPGIYPIRLRVNGVDSFVVNLEGDFERKGAPSFTKIVTVEKQQP